MGSHFNLTFSLNSISYVTFNNRRKVMKEKLEKDRLIVNTPLKALPGAVVAPVGGVGVGVAAAVARLAGVAHLERVAVVTVGASAISADMR